MKHSFLNSLNLNRVGLLEILFALTPMLSAYCIMNKPLSVLMWIILIVIVCIKYKRLPLKNYKPLTIFVIYWSLHTLVLLIITELNINAVITQIIYFLAIYSLYPVLDINKLEGSLNWIAIISIGGLLYQLGVLLTGGYIHPIEIPGLTMDENRLNTLSLRPSSFYMEPASYVAYMIVPLAISLIRQNVPWTIILILSIFLTTSTTGILISFIMIVVYALTQHISKKSFAVILLVGFSLCFALNRFDVFSVGVEKIEDTDIETNIRLSQGPYILSTMQGAEYIFGCGSANSYDYCITRHRAPHVILYGESVFVSSFWLMILLYGIVGLSLYLNIYFRLYKKSKLTLPLITCLMAVLFSSGYGIGGTFAFHLVSLLSIADNQNKINTVKQ